MGRIQEKSNKIQNNEQGMTQSLQESLLLVKRVSGGLNWSRGFLFVCVSKHTLDLAIPCLLFWILLDYFPWILYIVLHPAFNKLHLKISLMLQRFPSSPCVLFVSSMSGEVFLWKSVLPEVVSGAEDWHVCFSVNHKVSRGWFNTE